MKENTKTGLTKGQMIRKVSRAVKTVSPSLVSDVGAEEMTSLELGEALAKSFISQLGSAIAKVTPAIVNGNVNATKERLSSLVYEIAESHYMSNKLVFDRLEESSGLVTAAYRAQNAVYQEIFQLYSKIKRSLFDRFLIAFDNNMAKVSPSPSIKSNSALLVNLVVKSYSAMITEMHAGK